MGRRARYAFVAHKIACAALVALSCALRAAAQAPSPGVVAGRVADQIGVAIVDVPVALRTGDGTRAQNATTDAQGGFSFSDVAPGSYVVVIDLPGFEPFESAPVIVSPDTRSVTLPAIVLTVEGFSTSVTVRSTEAVADEQIRNQERQRLLGALPNFYVSYVRDAAPLTSRQKFSLAVHETFDWTAFAGASLAAAIDQSTSAHPGFGDGASGYAKRWAATFADNRTGDLLSHYAFASLLHQDPRYFYQGTGSAQSRLLHALSSAFVARSDRGTLMPNYAYILGNVSAAGLSNVYYPGQERGGRLVVSNLVFGLASHAVMAVTQEFLGKRLTTHTPSID